MKKGLSTNKSMSAFSERVINAIESCETLQVINVCAGRLSYITICKIIGCGIPVSGAMLGTAVGESVGANSEGEFNDLFYSSLTRQIGKAFCDNLHEIFADKNFDSYVIVAGNNDAACGVRIFMKDDNGDIVDSMSFDMNRTMSGDIVDWMSAR